MIFIPICGYLTWASIYYLVIFGISAKKIRERKYDNLYRHFATKEFFKKTLKDLNKWYWPFVFIAGHFCFFLVGHILGLLCFQFKWINYIVSFVWITVAFRNGSTFYMDYFASRYEDQLKVLP